MVKEAISLYIEDMVVNGDEIQKSIYLFNLLN
ncbi:hypothetical protein [Algoriphagus winogradskyi]